MFVLHLYLVFRYIISFSGGMVARRSVGHLCASLGDSGDDAPSASKKAFDDVLEKGGSTEVRNEAST